MRRKIISDLKFMSYAPVLFLSALTGSRVSGVFAKVKEVFKITVAVSPPA